ncbi:type II toxin-antitoxin system VapC family toxin [Candidatus Entotheonella palauensis]|uniref:type II toxin-antitoxin system VapC family toxin n=1 Tax=Candidatus Entotheonella palauensis TaxID=93172 RepID=UPI000B7CDFA2|nr:PIN domain-containing protein [Candidatus Entotheonella palauensis]
MDTSAHYALVDMTDPDHAAAVQYLQAATRLPATLVTSNFVLSETYTLLRYRLGWVTAQRYVTELRKGSTQIFHLTRVDEERAWEIFTQYEDQDFSYVDATSFALMERINISIFFAFDRHFSTFRTSSGQAFTDIQFLA